MKAGLLLIFILGLALPPFGHAQAHLQKVVLTYSNRGIGSIDLFIAQEHDFFLEAELDAPLLQVRTTDRIPGESELTGDLKEDAQISAYWRRFRWREYLIVLAARGPWRFGGDK